MTSLMQNKNIFKKIEVLISTLLKDALLEIFTNTNDESLNNWNGKTPIFIPNRKNKKF
jgi:hypothetical protein